MVLLEACVCSLEEADAAWRAGAGRLELCRELPLGGLTPSLDLVREVAAAIPLPLMVLLRPHEHNAALSAEEREQMKVEAEAMRHAGAAGLVFGVLHPSLEIDYAMVRALAEVADGAALTFHRAFDRTPHPEQALAPLAAAGISRVLCSGGPGSAWEGRERLRRLVEGSRSLKVAEQRTSANASGHLEILPAGGVRAAHAVALVKVTGAAELHARGTAIPALAQSLAAD